MPVDLSMDGRLGLSALADLKASVSLAKHAAMNSGRIGLEAFASSRDSEAVLNLIGKENPALVSKQVMRYYEPNALKGGFENFTKFVPPTSQVGSLPKISVHAMKFPLITQTAESAVFLIPGLHWSIALQNFL